MLLLINSLEYKTNLRLSRSSMLMNETNHNISITQWCWRELAKSQLGLTIRPLRVQAQPSHVMSSQTRASSYNACWNAIWEPCATDAAQSTCLGEAWSSASTEEFSKIIDDLKCRKALGKYTAFSLRVLKSGKLALFHEFYEFLCLFWGKDTYHITCGTLALSPFTRITFTVIATTAVFPFSIILSKVFTRVMLVRAQNSAL